MVLVSEPAVTFVNSRVSCSLNLSEPAGLKSNLIPLLTSGPNTKAPLPVT